MRNKKNKFFCPSCGSKAFEAVQEGWTGGTDCICDACGCNFNTDECTDSTFRTRFESAQKRIAELEAERDAWKKAAEDNSKRACSHVHPFSGRCLKHETMSAAKQVVWNMDNGKCGRFKFVIVPDYNYETEWSDLEIFYNDKPIEKIFVGAAPDDKLVMDAAQDWLNKLVAECAVSPKGGVK